MFGDPHAAYVIAAYSATAVILGVIIWATLSANARARKDLEDRR
ncbi:MAG: heme exporter protein CcmD [Pseudomonadota bacterium]